MFLIYVSILPDIIEKIIIPEQIMMANQKRVIQYILADTRFPQPKCVLFCFGCLLLCAKRGTLLRNGRPRSRAGNRVLGLGLCHDRANQRQDLEAHRSAARAAAISLAIVHGHSSQRSDPPVRWRPRPEAFSHVSSRQAKETPGLSKLPLWSLTVAWETSLGSRPF